MAWLALLAALMMAVAPTVSRALKSDGARAMPLMATVCTVAGMKVVDVSAWAVGKTAPPKPAHPGMDGDCGYCALVAATIVLLLAWALLHPRTAAGPLPIASAARARPCPVFPGLGSRGPPLSV